MLWCGYVVHSDWMDVRGYFVGEGEMLRFGFLVPIGRRRLNMKYIHLGKATHDS